MSAYDFNNDDLRLFVSEQDAMLTFLEENFSDIDLESIPDYVFAAFYSELRQSRCGLYYLDYDAVNEDDYE